jgi:hypothetical protein
MKDEHTTPRSARTSVGTGWEQRNQPDQGWERRNERTDRLREGRSHPLHHGRPLHGDHAFDGSDEKEIVVPVRAYPDAP